MGNLHDGHLELVQVAQKRCKSVIATIFVNPLQFGPSEDFDSYPRVLEADAQQLRDVQTDILFAPSLDEMYPDGQDAHTTVSVPGLTDVLCGANRPGHFDGVTTVVTKLFHLAGTDFAYFGEKDWQQLAVIRHMVRQLDFPLEIVGVATQRAPDGLALSSRNEYLSADERKIAPRLNQSLCELREKVLSGNDYYDELESTAKQQLSEYGFKPDYVEVRDEVTLQLPDAGSTQRRVFAAAFLGKARLIDNVAIDA